MSQLPVEILHQSFLYLNQAQKVECMLVCRHWARTIQNLTLLETVRFSSIDNLNKLLDILEVQPELGAKVNRLFLDLLLMDQRVLNAIPPTFLNLKVLFIHDFVFDVDVETLPTNGWNKDLEVLMEYSSSRMTRKLLSSGNFPHLDILYFKNLNYSGADIVPYFANAPTLTELHITEFRATISDYELLHQHLPFLRKLTINYGDITSSAMPTEIGPPKCLDSLVIDYVDVVEQQHYEKFLQYIGKKYTNIADLSVHIHCQEIWHQGGHESHKDKWNPVFASFGPRLRSIGIEAYAVPDDFFVRLDNSKCRIQELTLHSVCLMELSESLIASQQRDSIEKLKVEFAISNSTKFEYLLELPNLKNLIVSYSGISNEDFRLNEFLEWVPSTVELLSLSKCALKCNLKTEQIFALKELHLNNCHIPRNFDAFLTAVMPQIKVLSFEECKFSIKRLNLPQHNLDEFQMIACRPHSINIMLLETLDDGKKQWHYAGSRMNQFIDYKKIFKVYDISAYPVVTLIPYEEIKFTTFVGLVCRSLKNLVLIDKPTFK